MSVQKKIMKSVCQTNLALEGYRAESLAPLIEAHDQWESFFDQRDSTQSREEGASQTQKIIELDTSE